MPSLTASLAPFHIRAPLTSTPKKFFSGYFLDKPTEYSPLPQPNSTTKGLSFLNTSDFHLPWIEKPDFNSSNVG